MTQTSLFNEQTLNWWNEKGPLRSLHAITPLRIVWIRDRICEYMGQPLKGLKILDVGCGGGLTTEPLARLGAHVMGIDEAEPACEAARAHAQAMGLAIPYICGRIEELVAIPASIRKTFPWTHPGHFDVVTALEIVEHVEDLEAFVNAIIPWLAPGGLLILSSLTRTPRSFVEGVLLAEHVLKWVPKGAHSWNQFRKPSELVNVCREAGFEAFQLKGLHFNVLTQKWVLSDEIRTNYFLCAQRTT